MVHHQNFTTTTTIKSWIKNIDTRLLRLSHHGYFNIKPNKQYNQQNPTQDHPKLAEEHITYNEPSQKFTSLHLNLQNKRPLLLYFKTPIIHRGEGLGTNLQMNSNISMITRFI